MTKVIDPDARCKKCGKSLWGRALLALLIDMGCRTSNPLLCPEGGEHDFSAAIAEAEEAKKKC